MLNTYLKALLPLVSSALMVGCASYPAPVDKLNAANAAVRQAEHLGARADANSAMHMQLAREEIARGERLMAENENKAAEFELVRARADADLALAEARSAAVLARAAQAETEIAQVRARTNATTNAIAASSPPQPPPASPATMSPAQVFPQPVGTTNITSGPAPRNP